VLGETLGPALGAGTRTGAQANWGEALGTPLGDALSAPD
jgi:hypothetical protein